MAEDAHASPEGRVMFGADMICLDKRNSNITNHWAYYRITGIGNVDIAACRITSPELRDIDPPIVTPGNVGLAAAYDNIKTLLWKQWQIKHDTDNVIGLVFRLPQKPA